MCRSIHKLFNFDPPATPEELREASLQFVRKISGFSKPSVANQAALGRAVDEVAEAAARLLGRLISTSSPRLREEEAERARSRGRRRLVHS